MLTFCWNFEVDAWSRFWRWNLIKNCVWTCDMNSTLGSVVPLAMFVYVAGCGLKVNDLKPFIYPHKNPLKNKNTNFLVQSKKHYTCVYVAGCGSKVNKKQSRNSISASTTSTQLMWHLISPLPQRLFWSTINLVVKKWKVKIKQDHTMHNLHFLVLRWN